MIGYGVYHKYAGNIVPSIPVPIVIPVPKPELKTNILYDEYIKAKELAKAYDKKIVIVFGADWCPYCKDLKKDVNNISGFTNYIVCFINTDKEKELVKNFRVRSLPTSIIIDSSEQEIARKTGYKKKDYNDWLEENLQESLVSWMSAN
jgi:thioredoxin-related protein